MSRTQVGDVLRGRTRKIHLKYTDEDKTVRDLKIYVLAGEDADGRLVEISIKADTFGSTISGLLTTLSATASIALQHGVPAGALLAEWRGQRFEPAGMTQDPQDPIVTSIVDAVARGLIRRYVPPEE